MVVLALRGRSSLLLMADGARWIRAFFTDMLAQVPDKTMILDWYHLHQKSADLCSRICKGKQARAKLLLRLYRRLWRGNVTGAIAVLQAYRLQARNIEELETLVAYLAALGVDSKLSATAHRPTVYRQRARGEGQRPDRGPPAEARWDAVEPGDKCGLGSSPNVDAERRLGALLAAA
jgi:hypothetical protein